MHRNGAGSGVVWALVEDGFHVGSRGGEFLGYIDRQGDGSFLACDLFSRQVGRFSDLQAAMRAVLAAETAEVHSLDEVSGPAFRQGAGL